MNAFDPDALFWWLSALPVKPRVATKGFPTSLTALNGIFASYSASFAHAWRFEESSGNAADLATTSPLALVPTSSPTQGVSTGLANGDKGVQFADNSASRMEAGATGDLDVTTGDFWMLGTTRLLLSTAGRGLIGKNTASPFYRIVTVNTGQIQFGLAGSGGASAATAAADHSGSAFFDWIAVRSGGNMAIISNLADSGSSGDTSGDLTNTAKFAVGRSFGTASSIHTFFAWGTSVGTILANRAAALAAWRTYRGAA